MHNTHCHITCVLFCAHHVDAVAPEWSEESGKLLLPVSLQDEGCCLVHRDLPRAGWAEVAGAELCLSPALRRGVRGPLCCRGTDTSSGTLQVSLLERHSGTEPCSLDLHSWIR